jgi:hypothetical protein
MSQYPKIEILPNFLNFYGDITSSNGVLDIPFGPGVGGLIFRLTLIHDSKAIPPVSLTMETVNVSSEFDVAYRKIGSTITRVTYDNVALTNTPVTIDGQIEANSSEMIKLYVRNASALWKVDIFISGGGVRTSMSAQQVLK